ARASSRFHTAKTLTGHRGEGFRAPKHSIERCQELLRQSGQPQTFRVTAPDAIRPMAADPTHLGDSQLRFNLQELADGGCGLLPVSQSSETGHEKAQGSTRSTIAGKRLLRPRRSLFISLQNEIGEGSGPFPDPRSRIARAEALSPIQQLQSFFWFEEHLV